ncbi:MAG: nucleotidyltransferase family protein [Planctomycetota bacterium]|nr:nucleotidyltransferase family protein [Planctomycetota bacterium]
MSNDRQSILDVLKRERAEVAQRFGVTSIAIFGSVGRDEATAASDIDVLVEFNDPATFDAFFGLKTYLEDQLGRDVELATQTAIRAELRKSRGILRPPVII